jgi:hypothetical membrane protein
MQLLVWIHVISAIAGIGPTFAFGLFLQRNQNIAQLRHSLKLLDRALLFNKIGGPMALLSGIALVLIGNYGGWLQLWILGAILIYLVIMIISIPLGNKMKALQVWVAKPEHTGDSSLPTEQEDVVRHAHKSIQFVHVLSILLFTLMILKPVVF